jgi:Sulfotransferase domain
MKVIGAGLHRTGTFSLKAALEALDLGPCYHMSELNRRPEHAVQWLAAANGEDVRWPDLLRGYRSAVDWPACFFWERLAIAYPRAKVILTVRDPKQWFRSHVWLFATMARMRTEKPRVLAGMERTTALLQKIMVHDTFERRMFDEDHCLAVFRRRTEQVRDRVPAERLLVFDVREGWGPLCDFLGVDVPDGRAFPYLNAGASLPASRRRTDVSVAVEAGRPGIVWT